jgi:hypothetical protein
MTDAEYRRAVRAIAQLLAAHPGSGQGLDSGANVEVCSGDQRETIPGKEDE